MKRLRGALRERSAFREPLIAVALGMAGFGINQFVLDLGWGVHFIFGNALVFAFLRVLRPSTLIGAAALSSLHSVFLWNHPWAWAVWTIEAAALVTFLRRASPIRNDVGFWLVAGAPMLLATYGGILHMDGLSLWLVIAKQAANGVLNVTLGEILYSLALSVTASRGWLQLPRLRIEAFVMTILVSIILVPMTVYLTLDAPTRAQNVRTTVEQSLNDALRHTGESLELWQTSRALMLQSYAGSNAPLSADARQAPLPAALRTEFDQVEAFDARGRRLWSVGDLGRVPFTNLGTLPTRIGQSEPGARLIEISGIAGDQRLALRVPVPGTAGTAYLLARLHPEVLQKTFSNLGHEKLGGLALYAPDSRTQAVHALTVQDGQQMDRLTSDLRQAAIRGPVLARETGYGTSLMNDLKDAMLVQAVPVIGLPGWELLGSASLSGEVLKAREGQLQLFAAFAAFVLMVTTLALLLVTWIELSLRRLAQSAADLAMSGTRPQTIDSLVIQELSDISLSITTAGSEVAREHGALVSYRRRLRSIAEHAPVVVYALEVEDGRKGLLLYVSDAIQRLLGYSQAEVAQPGWWSHAVHPDDYDHCMSTLADLTPGKTVSLEYRLRHQRGHYVWVFDSLAIEVDPALGSPEAVGLLLDISDRKFAAEQLLQADKMASLGRMVAGVAHELNQPLNFIKMAAMNLRERTNRGLFEAPRFAEKLDTMIAHVNRASAIILQMRVFGRKPTEQPHPMALRDAVESVMTMVTPQLESEGTRLDISGCAPEATVRALPVLLEQVLLNLVLNAHDAISSRKAGGDPAEGLITIRIERKEWQAFVTVEDNGTGLPEEAIPLLFEPFFTTKPPREGTGLGLSICYGIVRDLGGAIWAENTGTGARFVIELPIVSNAGQAEPTAAAALPAPAG